MRDFFSFSLSINKKKKKRKGTLDSFTKIKILRTEHEGKKKKNGGRNSSLQVSKKEKFPYKRSIRSSANLYGITVETVAKANIYPQKKLKGYS